jgi:hypothetical protein
VSSTNVAAAADTSEWVRAMRAGEFAAAWAIGDKKLAELARSDEGRRDKHAGPRHLQRIWRGEELRERRVLVRCYHGLGDTIQFARFIPCLRRIAREVVVWCQAGLLPFLERLDGVDRALPLHDGTPDVAFDADIEIMEIPHAIRAGLHQFEMRAPYLRPGAVDPPPLGSVEAFVSVGLVWDVGDWDGRRRVPPSLLRRFCVDGVKLFALQTGPAREAATEIGAVDISAPDIETLGRRLGALDLVISVDTMVAHLSAALGCETWIMLHSECDWRWPASGSRTYWYPSARLFHQGTAGDWSDVIAEVRCALQERVDAHRKILSGLRLTATRGVGNPLTRVSPGSDAAQENTARADGGSLTGSPQGAPAPAGRGS